MSDTRPGTEPEWEQARTLRTLSLVVAVAQCVGAGVSLAIAHYPSWFENLWFGGALATFPGFLAGWVVQRRLHPNSLVVNRALVRRMAIVSAVLSLAAFVVPLGALDVS